MYEHGNTDAISKLQFQVVGLNVLCVCVIMDTHKHVRNSKNAALI